jgi:hypothetical protein
VLNVCKTQCPRHYLWSPTLIRNNTPQTLSNDQKGVDARGERSADGDDDYSRATVNATAHAGGLPAEGARMGMIKPQ